MTDRRSAPDRPAGRGAEEALTPITDDAEPEFGSGPRAGSGSECDAGQSGDVPLPGGGYEPL